MTDNGALKAAMRALPVRPLDEVAPGTSLILAPHPDDESLGTGGLIAALCDAGRPPLVLLVTDGAGSHPGSRAWPPERLAAVRLAELRAATAILGVEPSRVLPLGLSDGSAPHDGPVFEDTVARLAALVRQASIATIFATSTHDPHGDHVATARLAAAVARETGARHSAYPVWFWMTPDDAPAPAASVAGFRLNITAQLDRKRRAIAAHASQHGRVVDDDPAGFALPAAMLRRFDGPYETFLEPSP